MKTPQQIRRTGFTLLETVIAIGVLAVLLTGFMIVFTPAAQGIRKSINVQQADRLASTLEKELVTPRADYPTGFEKAFDWIKNSDKDANALLVYQYRGATSSLRPDGTPTPLPTIGDKLPGKDYVVTPMLRRKSDPKFLEDLPAVEGGVYLVKCTQLIFKGDGLEAGTAGDLVDPKNPGSKIAGSNDYPEAVIAFSADFHMLPSKAPSYFSGAAFSQKFKNTGSPVFTRNLAVRR
jgi:prepilin-type N-terminal cleavage/methylation domain-containing protein